MMCVDLGGPINKAAYAFSVGLLASQSYAPMAATMAAGMVPPIGLGIATFIARRKFAQTEREAGKAALVLGLCFISEGAIPFAAKDPLRVIPASIAGGVDGCAVDVFRLQTDGAARWVVCAGDPECDQPRTALFAGDCGREFADGGGVCGGQTARGC